MYMHTPPTVPVRVAAPIVLAIAALAVGVLWLSTGGGTHGVGAASPVTLTPHDGVVEATRAVRERATAARPSVETAARAPGEAARHERPATTSDRTTRPSRPHPRPGSPNHGSSKPSPAPTPTPAPQQDAAPPPPPPPPPPPAGLPLPPLPAVPPLPPPPPLPQLPELPVTP
jgi:hypothetical protein